MPTYTFTGPAVPAIATRVSAPSEPAARDLAMAARHTAQQMAKIQARRPYLGAGLTLIKQED
jgi:hypothetical protein